MAHWKSSSVSSAYAAFRPTYTAELFREIGQVCRATMSPSSSSSSLCVELGCGTGQATVSLAQHFSRILASDPSATQIEEAKKLCSDNTNISFLQGGAEDFQLENEKDWGNVDCLAVGQAAHWFNLEKFCERAKKALRPNGEGVVAVWYYTTCQLSDPHCHKVLHDVDTMLLKEEYWPRQRLHIDDDYKEIISVFSKYFEPIPIDPDDKTRENQSPVLHRDFPIIQENTTPEQFGLYLSTWSGIMRYSEKTKHTTLVEEMVEQMRTHLKNKKEKSNDSKGDVTAAAQQSFTATFPCKLLLFKNSL